MEELIFKSKSRAWDDLSDLEIYINKNGKYILEIEELIFFEEYLDLLDYYRWLSIELDEFAESQDIVIDDGEYCYSRFNPNNVEVVFDNTYLSISLNMPEFNNLEELVVWFKGLVNILENKRREINE